MQENKSKHTDQKPFKFIFVSGLGWLLDMLIYSILVQKLHVLVGIANLISASIAVSFVYYVSTKKIFFNRGLNVKVKYVFYLVFQICSIIIYSLSIHFLSRFLQSLPVSWLISCFLLSKILITPVNLATNYLFMGWLVEKWSVK